MPEFNHDLALHSLFIGYESIIHYSIIRTVPFELLSTLISKPYLSGKNKSILKHNFKFQIIRSTKLTEMSKRIKTNL